MSKSTAYQGTMVQDFITLQLSSNSFQQDGMIPARYTCDGININPSLSIDNIPDEAKCLAIIVDDPDAPRGTFCHWVVWNIPITHHIKEKETRGITGINDFGYHKYSGPCPPGGVHRYYFNVYALDSALELPPSSDKQNLEQAMAGHVLAFGVLIGLYRRE